VDLSTNAEALIVEPVVFGRAAHGEVLSNADFHDTVRIFQANRVIYADSFHLTGAVSTQLAHPAMGAGAGAMATLVLVSQTADAHQDHMRSLCAQNSGSSAGVSLLAANLLVMRMLAADSFTLRQRLLPVLDHLTQNQLPICWRL